MSNCLCPIMSMRVYDNENMLVVGCREDCALYDKNFNQCSLKSIGTGINHVTKEVSELTNATYLIAENTYELKESFDEVFKDMEKHIEEALDEAVENKINDKRKSIVK